MLLGVLRLPPDCWTDSPIDAAQRHSRYLEAADRIEKDETEILRQQMLIQQMSIMMQQQINKNDNLIAENSRLKNERHDS